MAPDPPPVSPLPSAEDLLVGRRVQLEPISDSNIEFLRQVEIRELGPTWRHGGETSPVDAVRDRVMTGSLAQFIALDIEGDPTPCGWMSCLSPDFAHGVISIAVARFGPDRCGQAFAEGTARFIDYVFHCWNFRKVYFEVAEYNRAQIAAVSRRLLREEGALRERLYLGGRYWDLAFLSLDRATWMASPERRLLVR